jgi:hypothetical protein
MTRAITKNGTQHGARPTAAAPPAAPPATVVVMEPMIATSRCPYCRRCGFTAVLHDVRGQCIGPGAAPGVYDPEPLEAADAA